MILPELGVEGQLKLKEAKVLMIGAGGLGCPVLQYLVAAGAGTIAIVDNDVVDETNLHRQILYSYADIGTKKALAAQKHLQALNPYVQVLAFPERLGPDNATTLLEPYDLVIDGSDNFPTRYLVNDTCLTLGKPLVFGSIFKFEGQVSVFNYQGGPSYRDLFPEPPQSGEVPNCAEIGVIGVLPGIIGCLMANEAVKVICEIGEVLSGRLLVFDALTNLSRTFTFAQSASAPVQTAGPSAASCSSPLQETEEIDMRLLNEWLKSSQEDVHIIDVREPYEFEEYNIGGINIPLSDLSSEIEKLPLEGKIVFCCASGQRSKMAIAMARPLCKAELFNLQGGIAAAAGPE